MAVSQHFAACFKKILFDAISLFSTCVLFYCLCLLKHIVQLLRVKKRAWVTYLRTGDISAFKNASGIATTILRQHKRCTEMCLIYYKYVNHKTADSNYRSMPLYNNDGIVLNDQEAADAQSLNFSPSFSVNHTYYI